MYKKLQIQSFIKLPGNGQMPGICIILSSAWRVTPFSTYSKKKILLFKILMKPLLITPSLYLVPEKIKAIECIPIYQGWNRIIKTTRHWQMSAKSLSLSEIFLRWKQFVVNNRTISFLHYKFN